MKQFLFFISVLFLSFGAFAQTASTNLSPTGNDPDGSVVNFTWSQVSGPNTATIVTPSSATGKSVVNNLIVGVYVFQVVGTDNQGKTGSDKMQVTVLKENQAPIIDAGPDQTIQMPGVTGMIDILKNSIVLANTVTFRDALVVKDYVIPEGGHYIVNVSKVE